MGNVIVKPKFQNLLSFRKKKPNSSISIMDLPEELWLEIFKNLETSDLRKTLKLVCLDWYRVIQDTTLYSHIIVDYRLRNESIPLVKEYKNCIAYVDIRHDSNLDQLLETLTLCENLKLLRLDYCRQCIDLRISVIEEFFRNCKYLSRFEIMYEMSPGEVTSNKIAIISIVFYRISSFSKFKMTVYTKEGWKTNRIRMSAIVHFEKNKFFELLYKMNVKDFIRLISQETFDLYQK